jgi:hypothetical protein
MRNAVFTAITVICSVLALGQHRAFGADMIDFETGFARLDAVSSVSTRTNRMHIAVSESGSTFVANVGIPKDGFEVIIDSVLQYDIPIGGNAGNFFLTDGPEGENNFLFDFDLPITEFSLDLYDYVGDGGARPTDFATLQAFSDAARTNLVADSVYVVPRPRPVDGLTVTMSVAAPLIRAVSLQFSTFDRGTGIDNIRFVTVPEPATLGFFALGAVAVVIWWARRTG